MASVTRVIERTDEDGLPTAAGKPGDGHAPRVGVVQAQQQVEAALHRQIERGHAAGAAQVELVHARVAKPGAASWPMPSHSTFSAIMPRLAWLMQRICL